MIRKRLLLIAALLLAAIPSGAQTQPTFRITSSSPTSVPAGAAGATLSLSGTLPSAQNLSNYQGCFYTGTASAAFALTAGTQPGTVLFVVPAAIIQGIPASSFTATNNFALPALAYIVTSGQSCTGTFDTTLSNSLTVPVVEPTLGTYSGPTSIPKTNATAGLTAPPKLITLTGSNFVSTTTVTFGSIGAVPTTILSPTALNIAVPTSFASSNAGSTASLSVCNSSAGTAVYCSTASPAIALTVTALTATAGTITPAPSPATTSDQTTLTAQFTHTSGTGAPSGIVTFVADGTTLPAAPLILDKTATFVAQTVTFATPAAATPIITPAAGSYTSAQTVTITDATPGASIFYTQDGSTPTSASTPYTGAFQIAVSQTVTAIAVASGLLNSPAASAAYTLNISPPVKLTFLVQPVNTAINTVITPAVQVAIQDVNGNTVINDTNPVTISLGTGSGNAILSGTKTVTPVNGIATFTDLAIDTIANTYKLHAVSGNLTLADSTSFNITPIPITMTVQSELVGIGSTLNGTITLGKAAPTGGVVVTLSSSAPANATIAPATLTIPEGQTAGVFTYTGVASGDATLSAAATNYLTGTATVTGTAAQVSLGTIPDAAPGQTVSLALSLAMNAPPGGTTVTFTSSNPAVATVTSNIFIPAGQRTASANPQVVGVTIGSSVITASAPGYAPATRTAKVTVVANFTPASTSIALTTSTNTVISISAPAQPGGLTFNLTSDDSTKVTVPATVTVAAGATSVPVPITGVANGSTTIRANSPGVVEATAAITVNSTIVPPAVRTGFHLVNSFGISLPVSPTSPVTVTVTSADPTIATLSKSATVVGTPSITFTGVTSSFIGTVYVQGQSVASTTLTVSGPGYTAGSSAITVYPSGISFYASSSNFSTTTLSTPTTITARTNILDPVTSNIVDYLFQVNPGIAPITVPITSGTTAVGTLAASSLVFNPGSTSASTTFQPKTGGTSDISLGAPSGGFVMGSQSQYQTITATVSAPVISVGNNVIGANLQRGMGIGLPVTPPAAVDVTITSSSPTLLISKDQTTTGSSSLTFTGVTSTFVGTIYIQGQSLQTQPQASATLTVSATGYTTGTGTISIYPSGFSFFGGANSFSTTTFSAPTSLTVNTDILTPNTLTVYDYAFRLNPGVGTINVPVTSGTTGVGTITTSPVVFHGGDYFQSTSFKPTGTAGTSTISLPTTPTGFSTPSPATDTSITATVTAPQITIGGTRTGVHLYTTLGFNLPQTPPAPVTVTIASSSPAVLLSTTETAIGTQTLTFNNVTSANGFGTIYVQGQAAGTVTLTASANGYTSGTSTVTVYQSGFSFYGGANDFTTTSFSTATGFTVYTDLLDANNNIVDYAYRINPGTPPVTIPIVSGTPSVGTITASPLVFSPGDYFKQTSFQPVAAGTSIVSLPTTVPGFMTPAPSPAREQFTVTVTAPTINVSSNVRTGVSLQSNLSVSLPVPPPNPVTVTVTSNAPNVITLSTDPTVLGTPTLVFPNITNGGIPTIYVQGQSLGTTTVTAVAAGYNNGSGTVTVYPSGFSFYAGANDFTTTVGANPTNLTVYTDILTPGTLTILDYAYRLNPGVGPVNVPITSSDTSVGTITTSPIVFNTSDYFQSTTFKPVAAGTSTISVGTPAGFSTPSGNGSTTYTSVNATVNTAP